jgi:DNA-binding transcriptional regulator GbsR (MarR family)
MDDEQQRFVEDFGVMFEELGGGRMVGRVLGLLMIADPPQLPADDIAAALHASRGSISQATRILLQIGMIRRSSKPGERRDYFQLRPDAWTEATSRRVHEIDRLIAIFERGLRINGSGSDSRHQLEESLAFMRFWKQKFVEMFPAWEEERERLFGEQRNRHA